MDSDILEVKKKIPSGNQIIRNHWAVNRRNKQEWALLVRNQMRLRKVEKATADDKYTLMIISYRKRKLDKDNLYTGIKSCAAILPTPSHRLSHPSEAAKSSISRLPFAI